MKISIYAARYSALRIMRQKLILSFLLLGILIFTTSTSAQSGSWTPIDYPEAVATTASGINDTSDIVGYYLSNSNNFWHGFKLSNGIFTTIDYPGARETQLTGINDAGDIVGYYDLASGNDSGFKLSNGIFTIIHYPGAIRTYVTGINDAGDIVGYYSHTGGTSGFKLSNGIFTAINYPGATFTGGMGINDTGDIVGWYNPDGNLRGLKLSNGILTAINYPGATYTRLVGINDTGDIVGYSGFTGSFIGFKLSNGNFTAINYPGFPGTTPFNINDAGDIVGQYSGSDNRPHGFKLTSSALSISGTVINGLNAFPIAGVTLTISGTNIDSPITTQTNQVGDYTFGNLTAGGIYIVTPILANYTFNPISSTFANLQINGTQNFSAVSNCVLSAINQSVSAGGGTFSININSNGNCGDWTAVSNIPWITITSGSPGNSDGTVTVSVQPNSTGEARSGTITIAGQTFTINQSSGTGGTQPILFVSNRDGNQEIYRMNADGTNQQRLTNSAETETTALWSPDGSKILFIRRVSTSVQQIWLMNADGTNQVRISPEIVYSTIYKYSPNGQKILFTRSPAVGTVNIWVMNADGSNPVQLTDNDSSALEDHFPDWSPDGSKIAYGHCATPSFICDIYTMNADGSNKTNLTTDNPNDDDNPKWTNDGNKIVFGRLSNDSAEPYIMNADGSNKQVLAMFGAGQYSYPQAISPDGSKVVLDFSDGMTLTSREIYMIGIGGGTPLNITNNNVFDIFNAWSPDSTKIAFRSRRDTATDEIYTMNADGTNVLRLTFNTATDFATDWFRPTVIKRAPFDFDGDGKTDIGIFRPAPGEWWINRSSSNQTFAVQFGGSTDKIAAADFTGDGKTDVAFFRPSSGTWFILRSEDSSFYAFPFGSEGDIAVPADYDGDGKADAAVFRESTLTWYIQKSTGGIDFIGFGTTGDKTVIADYDGDGKADIAITRINNGTREWWIRRSSDGQIRAVGFGDGNDKAVVGDYTGDGKADIAFWRPSTGFWYIIRSEDSSFYAFPFGSAGDVPTPGDYDGDGKMDAAVFRPSSSVWYQQRSTQGSVAITFGISGDIPIPSVVVP